GNVLSTASDSLAYTYETGGLFVPSLILSDLNACSQTITSGDMVKVTPGPDAGFTIFPQIACLNGQVTFTDTSLGPQNQDFRWYLGDGSQGSGKSVTHKYSSPGTYDIALVVTNTQGCTDSILVED